MLTKALLVFANVTSLALSGTLTTTEQVTVDGERLFTVVNTGSATLTGLTLVVRRYQKDAGAVYARTFYDALLNSNESAIGPGQSHTFDIGSDSQDLRPMEPSVEAALFTDGGAVGDANAIRSLWARRQWHVTGFKEVFNHFEVSVTHKDDRNETLRVLTQLEGSDLDPRLRKRREIL